MKKLSKLIKRVVSAAALVLIPSASTFAKLSDTVGQSTTGEAGYFFNIFMWAMMFFGVVVFAVSVARWIKREERQNPITWEYKGMVGGLVLISLGFIVGQASESFTGKKATITTDASSYTSDFQ